MILDYITKATLYSIPKNEDTIQKKFKPKVYLQGNHLECFFFHNSFQMKRKNVANLALSL
jgi:hypothetical protein